MGWKYEVREYVLVRGEYQYQQVYTGQWLIPAIVTMIRAKMRGSGCVKLEWR